MGQKVFALSTAAALVLGANVAMAATPVLLKAGSLPLLTKQFSLHKSGLSASTQKNTLRVVSMHKDFKSISHQRMQQLYQGAPVIGGYAIVHAKEGVGFSANQNSLVTGKVFQDIAQDVGQAPEKAQIDNALNSQLKAYKGQKISNKKASLVVFLDKNNKAHWAVKTSFQAESGKAIPEKPTAYVEPVTLKVFASWNDIKTERSEAAAKGYGGNERTGKYYYGFDADGYPALEITRNASSSTCYMENENVKVVDMEGEYYSDNSPMKWACSNAVSNNTYLTGHDGDGYDEINGAYSPTNDSMYAGYVIKHMYRDWYNLEVLRKSDGSPMQLVMRVHYGENYENAYWDGKQMTFGDGGSWMYPLVSMGVGAHEISHGFTEQNSGLEYWGQSGGMNESFSDMAAQAAEYYSTGEASWMIGERIMKEDSGYEALRFMDQPSKDGRSVDTAGDYYDGLDVHYSSGVYNHLFYLMSTTEGWTARKAFDVMVKANQDYWSPYSDFDEAAEGVLSAARDYGYDLEQVKAALDKVEVNYSNWK
jgi:pseudolysin